MTSITPNKMADNDMSFRQHAVIEFFVKEETPAAEIHQRLQRAYGSVCMGASRPMSTRRSTAVSSVVDNFLHECEFCITVTSHI